MKPLAGLLSLLFAATVAFAQNAVVTQPASPGLEVVKHSWAKERLNWEGNPFGGSIETFDDVRRRSIDQRRAERARQSNSRSEESRVEREIRAEEVIRARPPAPPRYGFRYTATFRNISGKPIKQIDWDHVFYDAMTNEVVGRIELGSDEKISPGKKKEFSYFVPNPPARTISVHALHKDERKSLTDQIVVVRVVYEDDSVWELP